MTDNKKNTVLRDEWGDVRIGWIFAFGLLALVALVLAIWGSVTLFDARSCSNVGAIYGVRSEYDAWGGDCYLQAPDGRMVERDKWYGYQDPAKQDIDLTVHDGGSR